MLSNLLHQNVLTGAIFNTNYYSRILTFVFYFPDLFINETV